MRTPAAAAMAVLLLAGCAADPGGEPACTGPQVRVAAAEIAPGEEVRVRGQWFFADCYDTGQTGTPPAIRDVEVRLVTGGETSETFVLTTVDADDAGRIDTTVRVPAEVPPGPARMEAGHGEPADVVVTAP